MVGCSPFVTAVTSRCISIGFTESVMSNIAEAKSLWTSFIAGSTG